ncbi:hypothetical protein C8J57DRAFT_1237727 [Mycena rebaudengoi]|nr:hypothetical protein C8J57DRAFT_1237727 [Mycena rebaudengoi]
MNIQAPDATVIVSHDDDWSDILGDDSNIACPADFLQRIDDQFAIVEKEGSSPALPTLKTEMDSIPSSSGSQMITGSTRVAKMEAIQAANNEPTFPDAHPDAKGQTKDVVNDSTSDSAVETTEAPVKRRLLRPRASGSRRAVPAAAGEWSSSTPARKRGRPPKEKKDDDEKDAEDDGDEEPTPKRKRRRPPKPAAAADPNAEPKKRGRAPKKRG